MNHFDEFVKLVKKEPLEEGGAVHSWYCNLVMSAIDNGAERKAAEAHAANFIRVVFDEITPSEWAHPTKDTALSEAYAALMGCVGVYPDLVNMGNVSHAINLCKRFLQDDTDETEN